MTDPIRLNFQSEPKLLGSYLRAVKKRKGIRSHDDLPEIVGTWKNVALDPRRISAYKHVCGAENEPGVPLHFPHVLANSVHLSMLTHSAFPVALLGCVHLRNHTVRLRQITVDERLDLTASTAGCRFTSRGVEFDLDTTASVANERVWYERTTFLVRQKPNEALDEEGKFDDIFFVISDHASVSEFDVPKSIGRQYAAVGKDYNPIHLYQLTAKPFGFRKNIAHGMWSLAFATGGLDEITRDTPTRMDVAFKGPLYMGSSVAVHTASHSDGTGLHLFVDGDERPAVIAAVRAGSDIPLDI